MTHPFPHPRATRHAVRALVVLLVTALSGVLAASGAAAAAGATSPHERIIDPLFVVTDHAGVTVEEFRLSEATPEQADLLEAAVGVSEAGVIEDGSELIAPLITIGFGVSIYVYLNRSDYDAIITGSTAFVATALCKAGGPLAIAACNTIASMIAGNVKGQVPPAGYCAEVRYSYPLVNGSATIRFEGVKMVKRSC